MLTSLQGAFTLAQMVLGKGNYGSVRVATCDATGREYACKTIDKASPDCMEGRREADTLKTLGFCPSVMQVEAVCECPDSTHIIMDMCRGGTLLSLIKRQALWLKTLQTLAGFARACHQKGILHNDIKPENLLLTHDDPQSPIKVSDFGLARLIADLAPDNWRCYGTPGYMAPEVKTKGQVSTQSDMYSTGVVLYHMLCGRPPLASKKKKYAELPLDFIKEWCNLDPEARSLIQSLMSSDLLL